MDEMELMRKIIKLIEDLISPQIREIINSSITTQVFPMKWKLGRVIPIQKSQEVSRLLPTSFRPISLLPTLSKLTERAVQRQVQSHFEVQGLLHPNSHAYRSNRSTGTALLQVLDRMYAATDNNLITSLMALDQSAAFDCVSHKILLSKLEAYKFSQESLKWMNSYLSNRSQFVVVGKHKSSIVALDRGVPQGSILGPLLYSIYTNELANSVIDSSCTNIVHNNHNSLFHNNCPNCGMTIQYADDTTYVIASKLRSSNQQKLNLALAKMEIFLTSNELAINVSKTSTLECMMKQKKGRLKVNHLI